MKYHHLVSVSGGKDSQATMELAIERIVPIGLPLTMVFADTGHEHQDTYEHIKYLNDNVYPIKQVRLPHEWLSKQIERKRKFIARDQRTKRDKKTGRKLRWTNKAKRRALEALHPTGNQFLDLCLWKGRFPSTRRRFCSEFLKHEPIRTQVVEPLQADGYTVISWQGVRADESLSRRDLSIIEEPEDGLIVYRPIITWTADDVFEYIVSKGHKYNPLYKKGMGRVGCMPCIHARKDELRQISLRFPKHIKWLDYMEDLVSRGSKRGASTFYDVRVIEKGDTSKVNHKTHGIHKIIEWSNTTRGGRQYDLLGSVDTDELQMCSSIYGLCESAQ